ncbi:MAG: hypothetical protein PHI59_07885 [Candidatus Omnitrophica bacterium]|nr:hypothetical protein [Candidatus Omnitrophota bacterium]
MKISEIILIIITVLLIITVVELGGIITSSKANANLAAASNRELADSNNKLEKVLVGVGENLDIVVDKFCGDRKKKN